MTDTAPAPAPAPPAAPARTPEHVINAKPKRKAYVTIEGVNYDIKAPKSALLIAISRHAGKKNTDGEALNRDLETILKLMFGDPVWKDVQARLDSAEDELDIDQIFDAIEWLSEDVTGNPSS